MDGRPITTRPPALYLALYKPTGFDTTRADPHAPHTVMELILPGLEAKFGRGHPSVEGLHPVGRLDRDSEGLLLLTNDGAFTYALTHPRHGVSRTYIAMVSGRPSPAALERLRSGVEVRGKMTAPAEARVREDASAPGRSQVELELREGRKRQVRLMLSAVGHPVRHLLRTRIGAVSLGSLKPGQFRFLTPDEVQGLLRAAAQRETTEPRAAPLATPAGKSAPRAPKAPPLPAAPGGVPAKSSPRSAPEGRRAVGPGARPGKRGEPIPPPRRGAGDLAVPTPGSPAEHGRGSKGSDAQARQRAAAQARHFDRPSPPSPSGRATPLPDAAARGTKTKGRKPAARPADPRDRRASAPAAPRTTDRAGRNQVEDPWHRPGGRPPKPSPRTAQAEGRGNNPPTPLGKRSHSPARRGDSDAPIHGGEPQRAPLGRSGNGPGKYRGEPPRAPAGQRESVPSPYRRGRSAPEGRSDTGTAIPRRDAEQRPSPTPEGRVKQGKNRPERPRKDASADRTAAERASGKGRSARKESRSS